MLDNVKQDRISHINNYLNLLKNQADEVEKDTLLFSFFALKQHSENNKLQNNGSIIKNKEIELVYHHISKYPLFHNMLFVNTNGKVFHSILSVDKHKMHLLDSLFAEFVNKGTIQNKFIDFTYIDDSENPSSFFIQPVRKNDTCLGYIIFQVLINRLNSMVAHIEDWSQTGEVLLINKSQYLMNNSRFSVEETNFEQKISKENLRKKFQEKIGHGEVVDYRSKKVLTSFEVFSFMDAEWLISSKIDKDEVLTTIYKSSPDVYSKYLSKEQAYNRTEVDSIALKKKVKEVLMDEYKRIDEDEILYTKSIHTCTGLLISYPGKFAYLAHISPDDAVYKNTGTALVPQMMKQIENKEIIRSEICELQFQIISPSYVAVPEIIKSLLAYGVFLSQIKVMVNQNALYADVCYDFKTNETLVYWKEDMNSNKFLSQNTSEMKNIEEMIEW